MKLRLRSLETRETLRIEIPNPSSLPHLKQLISQSLPSPPPSSSLHLSLNRSTELLSSSPDESLQSLGVTSGDLIYFTTNPNAFSPSPETLTTNLSSRSATRGLESKKGETSNSGGEAAGTLELDARKIDLDTHKEGISNSEDTPIGETLDLDTLKGKAVELDTQKVETSNPDTRIGESVELDEEASDMTEGEVEPMEIDSASKSFSVPGFLRRVFSEELGDDSGRNHKLLVIAIHAVLLESGLVGFDPTSKTTDYRFHVPEEWPTVSLRMSLRYTLPEIISHGGDDIGNIQHAVLKFNNIGKFFDVYGSLPKATGAHWVRVDEDRLVPFLNVIWANCGSTDETMTENGGFGTSPEKEVFEFWKKVKDKLALPLLIDLCERAGFELPPCFMRLPTDLKLKILELLPGVDIAKVGSLCSELRYLTASEDLWKQKYEEEKFGSAEQCLGVKKWKERFKTSWGNRKRLKNACTRRPFFQQGRMEPLPPRFIGRRNPFPSRFPRIVGGPDDMFPRVFHVGSQTQPGMLPRRRNTVPHCNLGGRC